MDIEGSFQVIPPPGHLSFPLAFYHGLMLTKLDANMYSLHGRADLLQLISSPGSVLTSHMDSQPRRPNHQRTHRSSYDEDEDTHRYCTWPTTWYMVDIISLKTSSISIFLFWHTIKSITHSPSHQTKECCNDYVHMSNLRTPLPIGILKTVDVMWKFNKTRSFFGYHGYTSQTPIYRTQ